MLDEVVKVYAISDESDALVDDEEEIVEEGIKALLIWRQVLTLLDLPIPERYPLKEFWDDPLMQPKRDELTEKFKRWQGY